MNESENSRTIDASLIVEALEKLEHDLVHAQTLASAQDEASYALSAVGEFIQSFGFMRERGLNASFFALQNSLQDISQGRQQADFLKSAFRSKALPTNTQILRGYCLNCVDVLIARAGYGLQGACEFVAHELRTLGYPFGNEEDRSGWREIEQWRKELSRDLKDRFKPADLVKAFRAISSDLPVDLNKSAVESAVRQSIVFGWRRFGRFGSS